MSLTLDEGEAIVRLARSTMEDYVLTGRKAKTLWNSGLLSQKRGVFVTLNLISEGRATLRGCIGFPYPVKPLGEAVQEASVLAAAEDPRFQPVEESELGSITVEVSVLTLPEPLEVGRALDLPSKVRVGRDGLIVSKGEESGLLLPQVAVEYHFAPDEFLTQTCLKAGLTPDAWLDEGTKVLRFQAEVFSETSPRGAVVRQPL